MKASNQRWLVYRRHKDDLKGVVSFNGPVSPVVETLQRNWAKLGHATGLSYKVVAGGMVDALIESASF